MDMNNYADTEQNRMNFEKWSREWLNETFGPYGLEPLEEFPKGMPMHGTQCSVGIALNNGLKLVNFHQEWFVGTYYIEVPREYRENEDLPLIDAKIKLPDYVVAFIDAYDEGCYPDLFSADWFSKPVPLQYNMQCNNG